MRTRSILLALTGVLLCATPAMADVWVLLIQPTPYSQNPPPYSQWQAFQQFDSQNACIDARMGLHYQYWSSDQDLSMRALAGVCRNEATGNIATDYDTNGSDDEP